MNNKKGFTLIELIGVIIVLAVLSLISVGAIKNVLSSRKESITESAKKILLNTGPIYFSEKSGCNKVYIRTLIEEEYISPNSIDPVTKKRYITNYTGDEYIIYDDNKKYLFCEDNEDTTCEYIGDGDSECD